MPMLDLETHQLHYRIDGAEGPWLVFCNSLGTDLHMWDPQVAELSSHFRVLRHDRRGHGLSTAPEGMYSLADLGGDVIALLDALGIGSVHYCGLSIGGLVAQWLAVNAPQRLDRVVACATAARIGSAESWNARIAEVQAHGLHPLLGATAERWFGAAFRATQPGQVAAILESFAATSVRGYAGCCAALAAADLRTDITRIEIPLLAIAGDQDPVCPPGDLQAIAGSVGNGRVAVLPGRHLLNIESPAAFNAALLQFLQ